MDVRSHLNCTLAPAARLHFWEIFIVPEQRGGSSSVPSSGGASAAASTGTQASAVRSRTDEQIDAVVSGRNADPFGVLGPQPVESSGGRHWVIRFFHPRAVSASVAVTGLPAPIEAKKIRP